MSWKHFILLTTRIRYFSMIKQIKHKTLSHYLMNLTAYLEPEVTYSLNLTLVFIKPVTILQRREKKKGKIEKVCLI